MQVQDGKGTGSKLGVNADGQVMVVTASAVNQAALRGDAYAWNAITSDIGTGDEALYVRNLSADRLLVINRVYVWGDVPAAFDIHIQTASTAFGAAGAVVVGVNLNTSSAKVADAEGYSDDDNLAAATTIVTTLKNNETTGDEFGIDYQTNDAIVLGKNGTIGVTIIGEVAAYECTYIGYFIDA